MDSFDSTKSGSFSTKIEDEYVYEVNWEKVKTFDDFLLLVKCGIISTNTKTQSDLSGKDSEIKKYFKTDGTKVIKVIN